MQNQFCAHLQLWGYCCSFATLPKSFRQCTISLLIIGFSKSGASHQISPTTFGALRAPVFSRPWAVKSKPPAVRVVVDSFRYYHGLDGKIP